MKSEGEAKHCAHTTLHCIALLALQARFEKVEELLSELGSCQERFGHLEGIFATDLQKQLPNEVPHISARGEHLEGLASKAFAQAPGGRFGFGPSESPDAAPAWRGPVRSQSATEPCPHLSALRPWTAIIRDLDGFLVTKPLRLQSDNHPRKGPRPPAFLALCALKPEAAELSKALLLFRCGASTVFAAFWESEAQLSKSHGVPGTAVFPRCGRAGNRIS